jgi:hypothetical protein
MRLHFAIACSALTFATLPSAAADKACQTRLEQAVIAITAAGPFRAVSTRVLNGKPMSEHVIEFAPPTDLRFKERTRLEGRDLEVMKEQMKSLPAEMQGTESPWVTYVGADLFIGAEQQEFGDPDRATTPPGQLFGLTPFADPMVYFAKSCDAQRITFEWDPYAITAMMRHGEETDVAFEVIDADRKTLRAEDDAAFKETTTVAKGSLELDTTGRPTRIVRDEPMPPAQLAELAGLLFPGVTLPAATSMALDIALTYDPAIKVAAP